MSYILQGHKNYFKHFLINLQGVHTFFALDSSISSLCCIHIFIEGGCEKSHIIKKNNRAEPFTLPVRCEERERKEHERRKRMANMKTRHERSVPLYTYFSDNSQIIMLKLLINSNTPCTDINKCLRTCVYLHCIQTWLLRNFHEFYFRIWNQKLKIQINLNFYCSW